MLDIKTFSWITSYTSKLTSSPDKNNSISTGLIIGIVCAVIVFLVITSIIGWFFYKRYRRNQHIRDSAIPTPGSEMDRFERDERDERDEFNGNRISNITSVTDNSNNENYRNSSTTDVTVISHSRPTSTYKNTTYGTTPYVPPYTPPPYYTPHGGFTSKNPPYSTRN